MSSSYPLSLSSRIKRRSDVVSDVVGGEAVLVSPKQARVRMLNETGSLIWRLADGTTTLQQMAEALAAEYAVTVEDCSADVVAFAEELLAAGVVDLVND